MDVEDFKDTFKYYTATFYDPNMHNSFIEKRNASNKKVYKFNFEIKDQELEHPSSKKSSLHQQPPSAINLMMS